MTTEIWKPIEGYEGQYEVSTMGNIRSLNYRMTGKAKTLKPVTSGKGYLMVGLCRNSEMRWAKVHRLVASAFCPNTENKPQVNHINGDKTDNRAENLEWVTDGENLRHAYRIGLKRGDPEWGSILGKKYGRASGEKHAEQCRKPVVATNVQTGEQIHFSSAAEVERILGINHSSVAKICKGKQQTAKGYTFCYRPEDDGDE